jgi:hypothetical protein
VKPEYKLIDGEIYQKVKNVQFNTCPMCGSPKLIIDEEKSFFNTTFRARIGCLSCNIWLQPARIKDKNESNS